MTPPSPIHILGAGIGGLTLARSFKNRGIPAVIFEKNPSPAHHNYGISLQPWAYQLLIKVLNIDEGTFVKRVAVDGVRGGRGRVYSPGVDERAGNSKGPLRAHRGRLEGLLREGFEGDVRWGHVLQDISLSETGNGHTLSFRDKSPVNGTLVVDTSGVHSLIRKALLPQVELNVLPYVVFRGTRKIERELWEEVYAKSFEDGNVLETMKGDLLLQIAVNDYKQDTGSVDISCIFSRPARADDPLHRPGRDTNQASDISEAFYEEVARLKVETLEQPFKDAFDGEKIREGRTLHWLMRDVIISQKELVSLGKKGVMMIGDSAHALPILGGEGACFAMRDAVEFAGLVADGGKNVDVDSFYGKMFGEWEDGVQKGQKKLREMHFERRSSL